MTDSISNENILVGHFITQMGIEYPDITISLENQTLDISTLNTWVNFVVRDNGSRQSTVGQAGHRKFLRYGFIIFDVYVSPGDATYDGKSICKAIVDMFEGKRVEGIAGDSVICGDGFFRGNGVLGKHYQFTGNIEYEYEDFK